MKDAAIWRDFGTLDLQHVDLLVAAKVEYLHRTVKDFLERPEIWDQVTAATADDFNPHAALARSYLLDMKWIRRHCTFLPPQWDSIFWIMEYAMKAESAGAVQVSLLDELDRVTAKLFPLQSPAFQRERTIDSSHLTFQEFPSAKYPLADALAIDFLHLAVGCDLPKYLKERLARKTLDSRYINSLLATALTKYDIEYPRRDGPVFQHHKPNFEVIKVMLDHSNLSDASKAEILEIQQTLDSCEVLSRDGFIHHLSQVLHDSFQIESELSFLRADLVHHRLPHVRHLEALWEKANEIDIESGEESPDEDQFGGHRGCVQEVVFTYR
jgi:hypothetical protein